MSQLNISVYDSKDESVVSRGSNYRDETSYGVCFFHRNDSTHTHKQKFDGYGKRKTFLLSPSRY